MKCCEVAEEKVIDNFIRVPLGARNVRAPLEQPARVHFVRMSIAWRIPGRLAFRHNSLARSRTSYICSVPKLFHHLNSIYPAERQVKVKRALWFLRHQIGKESRGLSTEVPPTLRKIDSI